jgi:pyruvate carboxylase
MKVSIGDLLEAGQPIATIEAMKMEAAITAPMTGRVQRTVFEGARSVEAGDLLLVVVED